MNKNENDIIWKLSQLLSPDVFRKKKELWKEVIKMLKQSSLNNHSLAIEFGKQLGYSSTRVNQVWKAFHCCSNDNSSQVNHLHNHTIENFESIEKLKVWYKRDSGSNKWEKYEEICFSHLFDDNRNIYDKIINHKTINNTEPPNFLAELFLYTKIAKYFTFINQGKNIFYECIRPEMIWVKVLKKHVKQVVLLVLGSILNDMIFLAECKKKIEDIQFLHCMKDALYQKEKINAATLQKIFSQWPLRSNITPKSITPKNISLQQVLIPAELPINGGKMIQLSPQKSPLPTLRNRTPADYCMQYCKVDYIEDDTKCQDGWRFLSMITNGCNEEMNYLIQGYEENHMWFLWFLWFSWEEYGFQDHV